MTDEAYGIQHARDLAGDYVEAITRHTTQLQLLKKRLAEVQAELCGDDANGRIILRLHDCGPTCLGCPHVSWRVQRLRRNTKPSAKGYGKIFITEDRITTPENCTRAKQYPPVMTIIRAVRQTTKQRRLDIKAGYRIRQRLAKAFPPQPAAPV